MTPAAGPEGLLAAVAGPAALPALAAQGFVSAEPRASGAVTYKLRWREGGRQRVKYLGSDPARAAAVRLALEKHQAGARGGREIDALLAAAAEAVRHARRLLREAERAAAGLVPSAQTTPAEAGRPDAPAGPRTRILIPTTAGRPGEPKGPTGRPQWETMARRPRAKGGRGRFPAATGSRFGRRDMPAPRPAGPGRPTRPASGRWSRPPPARR